MRSGSVELPAHVSTPATQLEPGEVARLLEVLLGSGKGSLTESDQADGVVLLVALTTGMRNEEVLGLDWGDVVLDDQSRGGRAYVHRVLQRVPDPNAARRRHTNGRQIQPRAWVVGPPKSKAGYRWVDLWPEVAGALSVERIRQRSLGWSPLPEGDLVFRNRYAKPLTDAVLTTRMRKFCELAGIPYRSFYALRHTFASLTIHAGESDVSVAEAMGHSDPATTKRIYARMFAEAKPGRMEKTRRLVMEGIKPAQGQAEDASVPVSFLPAPSENASTTVDGEPGNVPRPPAGASNGFAVLFAPNVKIQVRAP